MSLLNSYHKQCKCSQTGVALYIVLILIMVSSFLAILASRNSIFNDMMVRNESDYQRTFEAAQAMLNDAEMDIRGKQPGNIECVGSAPGSDICRMVSGNFNFHRMDNSEKENYLQNLEDKTANGCFKGICTKRQGAQDFWNDDARLIALTQNNIGARYGQFTGAKIDADVNPILVPRPEVSSRDELEGAWYWIEVLRYDDSRYSGLIGESPNIKSGNNFAPSENQPWVYRVTVMAIDKKKIGTEIVLQQVISFKSTEED